MKKTLISMALGLILSIVPLTVIYACDAEVAGCKLTGSSKSCDSDGFCVEVCSYNCGPAIDNGAS